VPEPAICPRIREPVTTSRAAKLYYGKVNNVATEEAQQAQDIVLGMFLASSYPATVLFDLGASHSFVSSAFVAKYHLPMSIMKHTMLVN
jgi:hypothetical protein